MLLDLRSTVTKSIGELRKKISQKSSELAASKKDLERYETVLKVLSQDNREPRIARRKAQPDRKTDWGVLFKRLPHTFTTLDFKKATAGMKKSAVYLRQILSRWTKQRKIKRLARGRYQKV